MLPWIEPDQLDLSFINQSFEFDFRLFKPLQSLRDRQALGVSSGGDLELSAEVGPKHLEETRLARAPGSAYADDVGRPAAQYSMAQAPDEVIMSEGVFKYRFVVAAHRSSRTTSARDSARPMIHAGIGAGKRSGDLLLDNRAEAQLF